LSSDNSQPHRVDKRKRDGNETDASSDALDGPSGAALAAMGLTSNAIGGRVATTTAMTTATNTATPLPSEDAPDADGASPLCEAMEGLSVGTTVYEGTELFASTVESQGIIHSMVEDAICVATTIRKKNGQLMKRITKYSPESAPHVIGTFDIAKEGLQMTSPTTGSAIDDGLLTAFGGMGPISNAKEAELMDACVDLFSDELQQPNQSNSSAAPPPPPTAALPSTATSLTAALQPNAAPPFAAPQPTATPPPTAAPSPMATPQQTASKSSSTTPSKNTSNTSFNTPSKATSSTSSSKNSSSKSSSTRKKRPPKPLTPDEKKLFEEWCSTWHIVKKDPRTYITNMNLRVNDAKSYANFCNARGKDAVLTGGFMTAMKEEGHTPEDIPIRGSPKGFYDIEFK
jgi:hypothetical protein